MPWEGVTVSEQKKRFIEEWLLNYYSVSELAERSRVPKQCPHQTPRHIAQEIIKQKGLHPSWGPAILVHRIGKRHKSWQMPAVSTAARILAKEGLVNRRRRTRGRT
jgi:putative transposase